MTTRRLSPLLQQRGMVQRQVRSRGGGMVQEPEATGGVVETTCVRDARGSLVCVIRPLSGGTYAGIPLALS
jgi:hypothetical protein